MTARDIVHLRLRNQRIGGPRFDRVADVAAWMGPMQGQDYYGAKWSVGLRMAGGTDAAVEQALADRTIVRSWPLRSTLHLVAAADVHWILALTGPRAIGASAGRNRQLGLDEATLARSSAVLARAMEGERQLTRRELAAALEEAGIATDGQRLSHILYRAGLEGLVCFGVMRGKQVTYTLLPDWAPGENTKTREDALAELARRYFQSRGPATAHDFAWWSGLTVKDARAGLEMVRSGFEEIVVDGTSYWHLPAEGPVAEGVPRVHLLPGFDEYMLAYTDRSVVLDERYTRLVHKNGMFAPALVIDGRVEGIWKRSFRKGGVAVEIEPFSSSGTDDSRMLAEAAARYGAFLGMPVV